MTQAQERLQVEHLFCIASSQNSNQFGIVGSPVSTCACTASSKRSRARRWPASPAMCSCVRPPWSCKQNVLMEDACGQSFRQEMSQDDAACGLQHVFCVRWLQRCRPASSRLARPMCGSRNVLWPMTLHKTQPLAGASLAPPVCDPLLGVANQRVLEEALDAMLVSVVRKGDTVALATCKGARPGNSTPALCRTFQLYPPLPAHSCMKLAKPAEEGCCSSTPRHHD